MKTAIITGASSGLGKEFARQVRDVFPEIQCLWLIARRADRLQALSAALPGVVVKPWISPRQTPAASSPRFSRPSSLRFPFSSTAPAAAFGEASTRAT